MKVFHRGLLIVGVPFLLEMGLITHLAMLLQQSDQDQAKETVYRKFAGYNAHMLGAASEIPFFLVASVQYQDDTFFNLYQKAKERVLFNRAQVLALIKEHPDIADGSMNADTALLKLIEVTDDFARVRKAHIFDLIAQLPKMERAFEDNKGTALERLGNLVSSGEQKTKMMQREQEKLRAQFSDTLTAGLIANALAAILLSLFYGKSIMARLRTINKNTAALKDGTPMLLPLKGNDEIQQLDKSFHRMDEELRLAASRQKELFDNASDVICVLDQELRFVRVNKATQRNWNQSAETLSGTDASRLIDEGEREQFRSAVQARKEREFDSPIEAKMATGDKILSWSVFWSQLDNSYYCVIHDVTEQKRSQAMKEMFLDMISRDLQRPLTEMGSNLRTLITAKQAELSKECLSKLQMAEKNLQRLLKLVSDLLEVTKLQSNDIRLQKNECAVLELLHQSMHEVESLAEKRNVSIIIQDELADPRGKADRWHVDSNRIIQVLVNLLSNAIKFSPDGSTIALKAKRIAGDIEVAIIDQGRGVPESHRELIFEKFKQVEAADGKRSAGTGLGLPICKQIIEDHGGRIGVRQAEPAGSEFWFLIPGQVASSGAFLPTAKEGDIVAANMTGGPEAASNRPDQAICAELLAPELSPKRLNKLGAGNLRLGGKGLLLIGVPLLCELVLVGSLAALLYSADRERQEELVQRNMALHASEIINLYFLMSALMIGDHTPERWILTSQTYESIARVQNELKQLVKNDRDARAIMNGMEKQSAKVADFIRAGNRTMQAGATERNATIAMARREKLVPSVIGLSRRLQKLLDNAEKKEFVIPEKRREIRAQQSQILLVGLGLNIIGSILLALYFSRDLTSRLQILADNTVRLSSDHPLNAPIEGRDEIAELDESFHRTATELQEAQKKESAVFDNARDIICSFSNDFQFTKVNQAIVRILQFSQTELASKRIIDYLSEDGQQHLRTRLTRLSVGTDRFEAAMHDRSGKTRYFDFSVSRTGSESDYYCVMHDISQKKEMEMLKQEFLAMVSHDLRTPLTSILGVAKLAIANVLGPISPENKSILVQLVRNGTELLELINDLLDIEKLEAGKMQFLLREVSAKELLSNIEATAEVEASSIAAVTDIVILADQDRIQQALTNVIRFITKGSDSEESRPNLRARPNELGGLTFEFRSKMIIPPIEVTQPAMNDGAKNRLALPIARKIIEQHEGTLELTEECLTVCLPKHMQHDSELIPDSVPV
jgi:PAS domain S-box-containing protein